MASSSNLDKYASNHLEVQIQIWDSWIPCSSTPWCGDMGGPAHSLLLTVPMPISARRGLVHTRGHPPHLQPWPPFRRRLLVLPRTPSKGVNRVRA